MISESFAAALKSAYTRMEFTQKFDGIIKEVQVSCGGITLQLFSCAYCKNVKIRAFFWLEFFGGRNLLLSRKL